MSIVSIANSEHVLHFYSTGSIVEFDQLNVGWAWERIVSGNKFVLYCLMDWENLLD